MIIRHDESGKQEICVRNVRTKRCLLKSDIILHFNERKGERPSLVK